MTRNPPSGWMRVTVPPLIVPAHTVVLEQWDDCIACGLPDPSAALMGYGATAVDALADFERKNFYWRHDLARVLSDSLIVERQAAA